jgi:DNA-binding GntR family transcriptional regulator
LAKTARTEKKLSAAQPDWLSPSAAKTLSLPEQIAAQISRAIVKGVLKPGTRIQEQGIADRFEVSRGPVREALRILERDHLVQILPRRGPQVTQLSVDEVDSIFEVRTDLIGLAAKLAAQRGDPIEISRMCAEMEKLPGLVNDPTADEFVAVIYRLTVMLVDASRNRLLRKLVFEHAPQTARYTRLGLSTLNQRRRIAQKWLRMSKALAGRDAQTARTVAEQLATSTHALAVSVLRSREEATSGARKRDTAREIAS